MKLTNMTIKNLINDEAKLTFLVGAGASVDAPSCLPAGRSMIDAIINYTCVEQEREKLLQLEELRYEQLVEIIRDNLDPELKLIDYYAQCSQPNLQHFFIAKMIDKGQFVMTTNFDFLIEHALLQSGVPKNEIISSITKQDFTIYDNPNDLLDDGKRSLYKIHGSISNMITGENTRDSLVTTIQAFGLGKEGENVFQVESFKRPLFKNISNNRTLVIMGYSGGDDFDIIPTLMVLKNLKNIVWINYIPDDGGLEEILDINDSTVQKTKELDKVNQILVDIYRMQNANHVYRVNTNTTRLIETIMDIDIKLDSESFSLTLSDWLEENVKAPNQTMQYFIPYEIYYGFNMYEDAMRCSEKIYQIAEKSGDQSWKALAFNNIGTIYNAQGNYSEALKNFKDALKIDEQLEDLSGIATDFNNIGMIYSIQGKYSEALEKYEEALKIAEKLGDLWGKTTRLRNIAAIYQTQGDFSGALKRYEEALKIDEQLGDLLGKANLLNSIGTIYDTQGKLLEALKRYEEALKISDQLGDLSEKTVSLNNIGLIYDTQGNYSEALKIYQEALNISEQLGNPSDKVISYINIAGIYYLQGKYSEALEKYEEALRIDEQSGNLSRKAINLNNIASIHYAQENYTEALKLFEEALRIDEQLGSVSEKATRLNNIGMIHDTQENYNEALKYYEAALKIDDQLGDLSGKSTRLINIGSIYEVQENYNEALKRYEEALKIDEQLENLASKATTLNNIASILYAQEKYPEALQKFELAVEILTEIGLGDSPDAITIKENIEQLKSNIG